MAGLLTLRRTERASHLVGNSLSIMLLAVHGDREPAAVPSKFQSLAGGKDTLAVGRVILVDDLGVTEVVEDLTALLVQAVLALLVLVQTQQSPEFRYRRLDPSLLGLELGFLYPEICDETRLGVGDDDLGLLDVDAVGEERRVERESLVLASFSCGVCAVLRLLLCQLSIRFQNSPNG